MTFIADNQPYKKITVQLSVMEKREYKNCFEGVEGLGKVCVLNERFNHILTIDRYFYDLELKAKRHEISMEYAVCQRKCVTLRIGTYAISENNV